jgi:hypothetical protein
MNIYDQIIDVCRGYEGKILTSTQIKDMVFNKFNTARTSVLPPDYCYNRINRGITFKKHIFIMINHNEYKFVGENYPYSGRIFSKPKGETEKIVGKWENGKYDLYDTPTQIAKNKNEMKLFTDISLRQEQIQSLYEEYMALLELEVNVFGFKPTETRHLIGRVGEFKCALLTNGTLSHEVNQSGFDVISSDGRKISVKTTAQNLGFISINKNTIDKVDELMILQYKKGNLEVIYHGDIHEAIKDARQFQGRYELDLFKVKKLMAKIKNT